MKIFNFIITSKNFTNKNGELEMEAPFIKNKFPTSWIKRIIL